MTAVTSIINPTTTTSTASTSSVTNNLDINSLVSLFSGLGQTLSSSSTQSAGNNSLSSLLIQLLTLILQLILNKNNNQANITNSTPVSNSTPASTTSSASSSTPATTSSSSTITTPTTTIDTAADVAVDDQPVYMACLNGMLSSLGYASENSFENLFNIFTSRQDNSAIDIDKRQDFFDNGFQLNVHKISDNLVGVKMMNASSGAGAGGYDYIEYDRDKKIYIAGNDKNNDGVLGSDEIVRKSKCVVSQSPLTFDLNGDGVKTSDKLVSYDLDGDGKKDLINDAADGVLSIRGGEDGKDLFGNNTDLNGDGKADGFANGFDALKALATQEGLINGKDDMVLDSNDIAKLQAKYQFGMKTGYNGEVQSLASLGITEINLGSTNVTQSQSNFDGQGNTIMTQDGANFTINGKKRDYADVWDLIKG